MSPGQPLHQEHPRSPFAGESQQLLSLLDCDLRKRHSPFFVMYTPDSLSRGRGLDTWLMARMNFAGVSRTDFSSLHAQVSLQLLRSRFATRTMHGGSYLAFTLRLLGRFFQHLCGRSHYVNLRECTTALWRANRSHACMRRSVKFALASLE